jgi:RHS repeat-associated protein
VHPTVRGDLTLTTDAAGVQIGDLRTYTPYGEPLTTAGVVDPDNVPDNQTGQFDYGWLGQHQRPYEHAGALSLVQMGARPYSPLLGRFLSVDPVAGGSANDYDYTNANPINTTDLDGRCPWCVVGVIAAIAGRALLRPAAAWAWRSAIRPAASWTWRKAAVPAGRWIWSVSQGAKRVIHDEAKKCRATTVEIVSRKVAMGRR